MLGGIKEFKALLSIKDMDRAARPDEMSAQEQQARHQALQDEFGDIDSDLLRELQAHFSTPHETQKRTEIIRALQLEKLPTISSLWRMMPEAVVHIDITPDIVGSRPNDQIDRIAENDRLTWSLEQVFDRMHVYANLHGLPWNPPSEVVAAVRQLNESTTIFQQK
jgi:hypothetical protein